MAGPSLQTSIFAKAGRFLTNAVRTAEGTENEIRSGAYNEMYALSLVRKQHLLADEGSYRIANNANQTGITDQLGTGFVATVPSAIIFNTDSPTNPNAKSIYLDFINLNKITANTAASTAGSIQAAFIIDNTNRFSANGTNLTANIISPNGNTPNASIAQCYYGAITATAQTTAARVIAGQIYIRTAASGTAFDVAGENKLFNFGAVESTMNGSITVANANNIPIPMPAVIIPPQWSALLYLWYAAGTTNAAGTTSPQFAWWER